MLGYSNHLIVECSKPPRDKNQRAFVGGSWSDSGEEDDEKAKDETYLMAQASSEVHSESSYFSDENSSIDDFTLYSIGIRKSGLYVMKLRKKPKDKICLTTIDKNSILWHRRLGHANMRLIQSLASKKLVRNLPKLKFDQHFYDACKIKKQAHASHKAKNVVSTTRCLELLHVDLFGPSAVRSYGGNLYTLVIVDDYSRTGHDRKFGNEVQFEEFCNANAILEKTPYELLRGRKSTLDYFKVFGSKCFILKTKDYLTKIDLKSYEGVFLGYYSKAYIILHKHTMKIEESLNVTFDETPPPSKTSPLVDGDLDEEETIKVTEKKNLENDIEDETLKVDEIVNIKESKNHPLDNVIGNLNQRTLSIGTESEKQDTSSWSGNDADADNADIKPVYDTELIAEIITRHRFSPNKSSLVYEKTFPSSCLRWQLTGRIFNTVGLRWIPTRKLFESCTGKVDFEPPHGFNVDVSKIHECKQTLDLSRGTSINVQKKQSIDLIAGTSYNVNKENLKVWLLKKLISQKRVLQGIKTDELETDDV
ncbi:retrovirus-related pol polyprotein from transposon TNT 1-94 [Tanacetum coccineum]